MVFLLPDLSLQSNGKPVPGQQWTSKKTYVLDELLTWACDMVTWYWSVDALFWQVLVNHNMDVQYQRCTYGNGATILFFKVLGLPYGRTDGHMYVRTYVRTVTWQPNFLDRWVTKFSKVWGSTCAPMTYRSSANKYVKMQFILLFKCELIA